MVMQLKRYQFLMILDRAANSSNYGCNDNVALNYDHEISIAALKKYHSLYADRLITLLGIVVKGTESILNYTRATITNFTGETLQFITNQS